MKCPFCGNIDSKVIDTRQSDDGSATRRRRECENCEKRFTTYERIEKVAIIVVKKDNSREDFDREKMLSGIMKSCEKRHITYDQMVELVDSIERDLLNSMKKEVSSIEIGEMIMERLKELDEVSYVRFASVYREFKDIDSFMAELRNIISSR